MTATEQIERLRSLASRLPNGYARWFYGRTVEFKADLRKAHKVLRQQHPKEPAVLDAIRSLTLYQDESEQSS